MSIYIHIPFCNSICSYCDFCKVYYNKKYIYDYLDNLKKEISSRYKGEKVNTIFIGGGTPSSLDIDELRYLFDIIRVFDKDIYCEFTMECNIDSISEEKLIIMKKYGINRVSVGVESFNDSVIKFLGRNHDKKMVFKKIGLVKKYFDNINADLLDLHDSIDKLSDDERNLIIARYYDGMTQNEASKILGISQVQVSRNEAKILKKLRTSL